MARFSIYRILGNDLPPRHGLNQTLLNIKFILENEPDFEDCYKHWIINRITDQRQLEALRSLLDHHCQPYDIIPFNIEEHHACFVDASGMPPTLNPMMQVPDNQYLRGYVLEWLYRHKSQAIVHLNYARNMALTMGRQLTAWTIPLDGACFFSKTAWEMMVKAINENRDVAKFVVIPFIRLKDNNDILNLDFAPGNPDEPQLMFRSDTTDMFDERLRYGNLNKAEILNRLNIPGPWQQWSVSPWEQIEPPHSSDAGKFITAGFVARLSSGAKPASGRNEGNRWLGRFEGIKRVSQELDAAFSREFFKSKQLPSVYSLGKNDHHMAQKVNNTFLENLEKKADTVIRQPIPSILDKTSLPPSGNMQDYFTPAPYLHVLPNGQKNYKDGQRINSAKKGTPENMAYDGPAFTSFIYNACLLTNAGSLFNDKKYLSQAGAILKHWFINPESRMNPNFYFAQAQGSQKSAFGIVEVRDLWIIPEIATCLYQQNCLNAQDVAAVKDWFTILLKDLYRTKQAQITLGYSNNIGTWATVLITSAALFIESFKLASDLIQDAPVRFTAQFEPIGFQLHEVRRTKPLHYSLFNLSGWISLAAVAQRMGVNLWAYEGVEGQSLPSAIAFTADNRHRYTDYPHKANYFDEWITALQQHALIEEGINVPEPVSELDHDTGFLPLCPGLFCKFYQ